MTEWTSNKDATDYVTLYKTLIPYDRRALIDYAIRVTQELYSHQVNPSAYCYINDRHLTPNEDALAERYAQINAAIAKREFELWLLENNY